MASYTDLLRKLGLEESKPEENMSREYVPSENVSEMVKRFEGAPEKREGRFFPYDSIEGGAETIGFGTKLSPRQGLSEEDIERFKTEGMSEEEANTQLKNDLRSHLGEASQVVGRPVQSFLPENVTDSLSSYFYNTGAAESKNPSLFRFLKEASQADKEGDVSRKSDAIGRMIQQMDITKGGGKELPGLVKRRQEEQAKALEGGMSIGSPAKPQTPKPKLKEAEISRDPAQRMPEEDFTTRMLKATEERDEAVSEEKKSLEQERADRLRNAAIIRGLAKMAGGFAGTASGFKTPVNVDSSIAKDVINAEYQAKLNDLMKDTNSEVSKIYQDFGKKMFPDRPELFENMSAQQFEKVFPVLSKQIQAQDAYENALKKMMFKEQSKIESEKRREERDIRKAEVKEDKQIKKENRELRQDLNEAQKKLQTQLDKLENVKDNFLEYSKKSIGGTGPLATMGGVKKYTSQDLEKLDSQFKNVQLDKMVEMFSGMSKAVDSDAERAAFTATQPSITNDDETNLGILNRQIAATKSLIDKTEEAKNQYDRTGAFREAEQPQQTEEQSKAKPGDIVRSGGKRYRVLDEEGNLEEL